MLLHDRTGGGTNDILETYTVSDFANAPVAGDWTLKVSDGASRDTGTFDAWVLEIVRTP